MPNQINVIKYDEMDWTNERTVELKLNGEVVETFYLDIILQNYMQDMPNFKYIEV
jgi:hypothetical protein